MIKIENAEVYGFSAAIRGMRNPMNSWNRSDSNCKTIIRDNGKYVEDFIGDNDLKLMRQLAKSGPVHAKYRRMITVTCDITAPLYWWKEFDTYKVGTVRNSCSTMHKIAAKEFTLGDFSIEHLITRETPLIEDADAVEPPNATWLIHRTIQTLNQYRNLYLQTKDKKYWWQMIQLLPSSYNQRATVQFNYEVLAGMYYWRKDHKLDEWHTFCEWIESLPYSEIITGGSENGED